MHEGEYVTSSPVRRGCVRFARAYQSAILPLDRDNEYGLFGKSDSEQFPVPKDRAKIVRIDWDVPTFQAVSGEGQRTGRNGRALSRTISGNSLDLHFFPSLYSDIPLTTGMPPAVTVRGVVLDLYRERVMPALRACAAPVRWLAEARKIPHSRLRTAYQASRSVFRRLYSVDGTTLLTRRGLSPSTHEATA